MKFVILIMIAIIVVDCNIFIEDGLDITTKEMEEYQLTQSLKEKDICSLEDGPFC